MSQLIENIKIGSEIGGVLVGAVGVCCYPVPFYLAFAYSNMGSPVTFPQELLCITFGLVMSDVTGIMGHVAGRIVGGVGGATYTLLDSSYTIGKAGLDRSKAQLVERKNSLAKSVNSFFYCAEKNSASVKEIEAHGVKCKITT